MSIGIRIASAGAMLCAVALVGALFANHADARQKKPGSQGVTCDCQCHSDKKNSSGLPIYYESVSFSEPDASSCYANSGFAGCRIKVGGGYVSGTLHLCTYRTEDAATRGNAGVDPSGGNGPTQPFSRPGIILLPNP